MNKSSTIGRPNSPRFRRVAARVENALATNPCAVLTGPRQTSKTTLAREIASRRAGSIYLDCERPSAADLAEALEDELFAAREQLGGGVFPKPALGGQPHWRCWWRWSSNSQFGSDVS